MKTASRMSCTGMVFATLMLGACASTPLPPADAQQAAEISIGKAEEARAAEFASVEMRTAREKIISAKEAEKNENMAAARQYYEQARVDADLATAKADKARADAANEELRRSIQSLRDETKRNVQ